MPVRFPHAALNTLLQGAGAVIVKQATVLAHQKYRAAGLVDGRDYFQAVHVHDEWQVRCKPEYSNTIKECGIAAVIETGPAMGFKCRLAAEGKIGKNWAQTH